MPGGTITDHVTPEELDRLRALKRGKGASFCADKDALLLYGVRAGATCAEVAAWVGLHPATVLHRMTVLRDHGFDGEWQWRHRSPVDREPPEKPTFPRAHAPVLASAAPPKPAEPPSAMCAWARRLQQQNRRLSDRDAMELAAKERARFASRGAR